MSPGDSVSHAGSEYTDTSLAIQPLPVHEVMDCVHPARAEAARARPQTAMKAKRDMTQEIAKNRG